VRDRLPLLLLFVGCSVESPPRPDAPVMTLPDAAPGARCVPGQVTYCPCTGNAVGAQTCAADGLSFGPCACPLGQDAASPQDAAQIVRDAAPAPRDAWSPEAVLKWDCDWTKPAESGCPPFYGCSRVCMRYLGQKTFCISTSEPPPSPGNGTCLTQYCGAGYVCADTNGYGYLCKIPCVRDADCAKYGAKTCSDRLSSPSCSDPSLWGSYCWP